MRARLERQLLWISLALGMAVLAAVPLHAALRADAQVLKHPDYVEPACETPLRVFPEPFCPKVVAGESPAVLAYALLVVPVAIRRGGRRTMLALTIASLALAAVQLTAPFAYSFAPTDGGDPSPFDAEPGCGLVNCGLDHTLFHLVQVPFLLAMAAISWRLRPRQDSNLRPAA